QSGQLIEGILTQTQKGYEINNLPVRFNESTDCFNTAFDDQSKSFYLNKPVTALINQSTQPAVILSILEHSLFSTSNNPFMLLGEAARTIQQNPLLFLTQEVYNHPKAKSNESFMVNLEKTSDIKPGDSVLMIILGGRTGDDFEAVGGHLSLGFGQVSESLTIDTQISNFYPRLGEKGIIPAHTHLIDFFGGLTIGQLNYRPNYCLVLYGINTEKIDKMRTVFGEALHYMRSSNDPVGPTHNCCTTTWVALNSVGFVGKHNPDTQQTQAPYYPRGRLKHTPKKYSPQSILYTVHKNSIGEIFPRIAFEQIAANRHALNPKRIDFIFLAQTPSKRAIGGKPMRTCSDFFWFLNIQKIKEKIEASKRMSADQINRWVKKTIDWRLK
ncbi:MAG: hypothetical protein OXE99_03345, partial [Cellvibrionales bacterium]|nr:hypothetical protein [Cellvibrionales bacterium]